jgi:NAD(P)-dependent dehydrogenase (short-subunit alcohol dehydrogenase family)
LNIRINCVCPSFVDTDMVKLSNVSKKALGERIPLGRICQPEEVSNVVCFLLSDKSSYINGVDFPICGGLSSL